MTMLPMGMGSQFGAALMPQEKKPTGMFGAGKGNIGEILSAAIFGALAGRGNAAGTVGLQALHQRRRDAHESEMAQQNRENEFQDFVRKESWKMANQGPPNNDTVADYNFRVQTLGKEAADEWLRNPPQYMNVPGVGLVQVPRMGGAQMGAPAPQGVTFEPLDDGGAGPQAPRPFR